MIPKSSGPVSGKAAKVLDLHKSAIGHYLTLAESALPEQQFKAFKKLVLSHFYEVLRPQIQVALHGADQVEGSTPRTTFIGREGGAP